MIHFGVIHATQRISPTLHVTAASLEVAGVPFFTVFPDSGNLGASANLARAIRFMSKSAGHEDHVCVLDDDLVIGSLAPLYAAVERDPRGLYSLWTIEQNIPHERRRETGWIGVAPHMHLWGGSVVIPARMATSVAFRIASIVEKRPELRTKPDAALFHALEQEGVREVCFHVPSLVTHIGSNTSTLGNDHSDGATRGYRFNEWIQ